MKTGFLFLNLMALVLLLTATTGCQTEPALAANNLVITEPVNAAEPSCANPTPELAANCAAMAERILASTVRIEFHGPSGGIGHGTVVGGRFLITHNHYPVSGAALAKAGNGEVSGVSVYKANGDIILLEAPLTYFFVAAEKPETLVFDFKEYAGVGFFDSLGVPSAESKAADALSLQPGREVAQVDWDGSTAHVDWVQVTAVYATGDTPQIQLDNFVEQGASGGGVFYEGVHVANTWSRQTDRAAGSGEVLRQYSVAALN